MKAFLCYSNYYDYCNVHRDVEKVVDTEEKAIEWELSREATEQEWNSYVEWEVE